MGVLEPQHREIAALVAQQHLGVEFALVGERDANLIGALDDVVIGDDDAARINDHAGAERALDALAGGPHAGQLPAEEAPKERIVEEGVARALHLALRVDVHHRGRRALHHRSEGERDFRARLRCGGLRRLGEGRNGEKRDRKREQGGASGADHARDIEPPMRRRKGGLRYIA